MRKHVRDVLSFVAERLGRDIDFVCSYLDRPESVHDLENLLLDGHMSPALRFYLSDSLMGMRLFSVKIENPHLLAPTCSSFTLTLADLENNQHSNLIPIDLRSCLSECMARMNYFSVRIENPHLLAPTWRYQNGWCYAVSMIRQFEAILKRYKLIEPDIFLSVQDLINQIPRRYRLDEGDISSLRAAKGALLAGITTEQFCPLGSAQRLPGGACIQT
ncbi:unnamed protein product [Arabidopsis halleri]